MSEETKERASIGVGLAAIIAMPLSIYFVYLNYQSLMFIVNEAAGTIGTVIAVVNSLAFVSALIGFYFANQKNQYLKAMLALLILPAIGAFAGMHFLGV